MEYPNRTNKNYTIKFYNLDRKIIVKSNDYIIDLIIL